MTGHYKLDVKVNGKRGSFILDTGASSSCIGFEEASLFLLKNEKSEIKAAGAGAINMKTEIAYNNHFVVGKKELKDMSFVIFDLTHVNKALNQVEESPVQGILGADYLKRSKGVIDYGRNALYLK